MVTGTGSSLILSAARIFILIWAIIYSVWGYCFNNCSGNGECNKYGLCDCWGDYVGWDCSSRRCPSGSAWSDLAVGKDDAHNDAVCSNMGHCDRETGSCVCHDGFEGRACERMSCPNGCSGHGQCISMAEAAATDDGYRLTRVTSYDEWDAEMIYGCICDSGYEGYDCSRRHCPTSDSASTSGQQDESVILYCRCGIDCASTFRLRYKGQYATITPSMGEDKVAAKLMALPIVKSDAAEYRFSPIVAKFSDGESSVCSLGGTRTTITFARDPGDLPPVYIKFNKLTSSDGADVHMTTMATLSCTCNGECGGHFRFIGNRDEATEKLPFNAGEELIQAELLGLSGLSAANITVGISGGGSASCEDFSTVNTSISIDLEYGNYPLQVVASMYDRGQRGGEMTLTTNDGNKEQEYCAGRGTCNFETGQCICDENYGYGQDYGSCGQYIFSHSHWAGRQMCPGFVLRPTFDILPEDANDWQLYFSDGGVNFGDNYTLNRISYSTVFSPGFYWFNQEEGGTDDRILFTNAINVTTDISNAFALDMTYRVLYYGKGNKVLRVNLPSDLSAEEVAAAGNSSSGSPVEVFVVLPEDEAAGYLEMDLRPEERYLYWTVPGSPNIPDGKVHRKKLSNGSDETIYEDLTDSIRSGMTAAGLDLMEPLGIALDLRDEKMYFTDAQIRGDAGGEDGIIIRCELDGSGAQVVADYSLSDPRALVMDVREGIMYLTDTHIPSLIRVETSNFTGQQGSSQISTILRGVTQPRQGLLTEETYYQPLLSPQSLQFDTRVQDLTTLFISDYETGYIYTVATDGTNAKAVLPMGRPKGFIFDLGEGYPTYTLYSDCHGHGVCSGPPYFTCSCDEGWEGNCAQKSCPKGPAWFDEAAADGSAHAYAECSNLGHCNRDTGMCTCHEGFTGDACQRMKCPNDCSGNGKCLSMRQLGLLAVDDDLRPSPATYGSVDGNPSTWDADAVYGCFCDWMGYQGEGPTYTNLSDWTGYDCSRKSCPTGDDIKRTTVEVADFERQNVSCILTAGSDRENSSFSLAFRQGTTDLMGGNASLVDLEEALENLITIGDVEVTMRGKTSSSTLNFCNSSSGEPASVTFKTELGDLPLLSVASSDGVKIDVVEATRGTKLDAECSRHGICDYTEGECICFEGWGSSDGNGAIGHRRDCGWYKGVRKSS